jgi:hypothetical protein
MNSARSRTKRKDGSTERASDVADLRHSQRERETNRLTGRTQKNRPGARRARRRIDIPTDLGTRRTRSSERKGEERI